MMPMLMALTEGPNITLDKPIVLIGRHQECDVLIPSRKISRRHCCIAQVNNYVVVKDLFSTNGVRINGARVKEGCLRTGDELTIGNFRYKMDLEGSSDAPRPLASIPAPQSPPKLVPADQAVSCDMPMPLEDHPNLAAAPRGRPLVLPVNGGGRPEADLADKIQLEFRK